LLTLIDGHRMAVIPPDTVADAGRKVEGHEELGPTDVLILKKKDLQRTENELTQPSHYRHMARSKDYVDVFSILLLLSIVISNVPLLGLWSVLIIPFLVL